MYRGVITLTAADIHSLMTEIESENTSLRQKIASALNFLETESADAAAATQIELSEYDVETLLDFLPAQLAVREKLQQFLHQLRSV